MSTALLRWHDGSLHALEHCDMSDTRLLAADSWFMDEGRVRGIDLHRDRFLRAVPDRFVGRAEAEAFWDAAIAALPRSGEWFPRVELQERRGAPALMLRVRSAPARARSIRLATWRADDPRRTPTVKGPDIERLAAVRTAVQRLGADEAVICSTDGYVVEGTTTALVWWRGDELVVPDPALRRVDSVTATTLHVVAAALGVPVRAEFARPEELDGREIWALNALHGIRIVTAWVDGPAPAEDPGRLGSWRGRLDAIARPLPHRAPHSV